MASAYGTHRLLGCCAHTYVAIHQHIKADAEGLGEGAQLGAVVPTVVPCVPAWDMASWHPTLCSCPHGRQRHVALPEVVARGAGAVLGDAVQAGEGVAGQAQLPGTVQVAHPADLDAQHPALPSRP